MKPSITQRWIVVGAAAALGVGGVAAAAVALDDQVPTTQSVDAVTLQGADDETTGTSATDPVSTDVVEASPESADSPASSAVDSADSPQVAQQQPREVVASAHSAASTQSAQSAASTQTPPSAQSAQSAASTQTPPSAQSAQSAQSAA